jgi:hypothetical protein
MASDLKFRVRWQAGEIVVHAKDEKAAINVGIEYLRVIEARRIIAELCSPRIIEEEASAAGA